VSRQAAIYCRISSDQEGDRLGVGRQEEDCRRHCVSKGWEVVEVYVDNDVSAFSGRTRPAYARMLDDVRVGRVNALVAWQLDRLYRRVVDLEYLITLCEFSGCLMATPFGDVDLASTQGRTMARYMAVGAMAESELKRERIRRKHLELAQKGRMAGGADRPFGYEEDRRTIRLEEAEVLRDGISRVLAGDSLRSIAIEWNRRGIKSVRGGEWSVHVLKRMLLSARIAGLRDHPEVGPVEAEWAGIITPETREQLKAILSDPSRRLNQIGPGRTYLLTGGLGYCSLCGSKLVARPRRNGRRCYVCATGPGFKGCGKIRQLAEPLESFVRDAVLHALAGPGLARALEAASGEDERERSLFEALRGHEARREELAAMYAAGEVSRATFIQTDRQVSAHVEDARRELASSARTRTLARLPAGADDLKRVWEKEELDWRRALLSAVLERVEVGSAVKGRNFFDPGRVRIIWRF
jgi:DNA invertase Pin-like site-specific DNA recombinase